MKKFQTASGEPPILHRNSANLMQSMLDEVKTSITILPELQALIPPLQSSEQEQLEANIRKEGCREALLIWQTTQGLIDVTDDSTPLNILIDGHNRYSICAKNNIDFKVILREFPTLQAVRDFMIDNQLGRRNLSPEQMSYLRGLKYRSERQAAGRPSQDGVSVDQDKQETKVAERTQDRLAKAFNVSPRTIHRDREYSEGLDKLTPELKQDILKGKQKIPKEVIRAVGRTVSEEPLPLSLPDVLAFNELGSGDSMKKNAGVYDISNEYPSIINEIAQKASVLDPTLPTFQQACDELIALIETAKEGAG
jgi:hypothetical protein